LFTGTAVQPYNTVTCMLFGIYGNWHIFLSSSLITVQNLVPISHIVCTNIGGPNFFRCWGSAP